MHLFSKSKRNVLAPDSEFMPRYLFGNTNNDNDDDGASIVTYSTMATTGSNRGAGWTLDRYFYQRAGRWIESWASRIGLRFGATPPSIIAWRLQDLLHPKFKWWNTLNTSKRMRPFVKWEFAETNRVTIDNGIDCLVKQMQSPSLSRRAVACAVLIRFQTYRHDTLQRTYEALAKRHNTKSIRARGETVCSSYASSSRHPDYSRLLLEFLRVCDERKCDDSYSEHTVASMKIELLRLIENIQSSSYDPVIITHKACVTLHKCLLEWNDSRFAEIFYFYMCFLLNVLQHVLQTSNASLKQHHISLIPYIHWIDSILPSAFARASSDAIHYDEILTILRFYSLFSLHQTRILFPRVYTETNFSSGPYGAAKARAAIDSASFRALSSHIQGDVEITEVSDCRRVRFRSMNEYNAAALTMHNYLRMTSRLLEKRMAEKNWLQLFLRCLGQRVWKYIIKNEEESYINPISLYDEWLDAAEEFDRRPVKSRFKGSCNLNDIMKCSFLRTKRTLHLEMRMMKKDWLQLIPRYLDQRVWECFKFIKNQNQNKLYIDLSDIFSDDRFDSMSHSLNPPACSSAGAVLFGGDSIPVFEYSRDSRNPITIAIFCEKTGQTIHRTVELSPEEIAALEAEDDAA